MKAKTHGVAIVEYENAFNPDNLVELVEQECSQAWGYLHWERSAVGEGDISNARTSMSCELGPLGQDDISVESIIPIAASWRKVWEQIEPYVGIIETHLNSNSKKTRAIDCLSTAVAQNITHTTTIFAQILVR